MSKKVLPDMSISSFAAPTEQDIAVFDALSDDEKRALLHSQLDLAKASGISDRTVDDIWQEALKRAGRVQVRPV